MNTPVSEGGSLTAFVSGGTRASGAAIARELVSRGFAVAVAGRSQDAGEEVARSIRDEGGSAVYVPVDLSDEDSVRAAIDRAGELLGPIDVVVNNAAAIDSVRSAQDKPVAESSPETFDYMMRVGVYGPYWIYRHTLGSMLRRGGGTFVNVSSLAAAKAIPSNPAYCASKAALEALSRQVCADYGRRGIRSNVVRLGRMSVPGNQEHYADEAYRARALDRVMTPDVAYPRDLAAAVGYLASDESRFVNGSILELDGGEMSLLH